jgi:hypothetical protein
MNSCERFADTVVDLFRANNWIGAGDKNRDDAVQTIYNHVQTLYDLVVDAEVSFENPSYSVSSGHVKVIKWYWDNEPSEIEILVSLETELEEDSGVFTNIRDYGYPEKRNSVNARLSFPSQSILTNTCGR